MSWELSTTVDKMKTLAALREGKGENTDILRFAISTMSDRIRDLDDFNRRLEAANGGSSRVGATPGTTAVPFRLKPTEYSGALFKPFEVGSSDVRYCGQNVAPATLGTILDGKARNRQLAQDIASAASSR